MKRITFMILAALAAAAFSIFLSPPFLFCPSPAAHAVLKSRSSSDAARQIIFFIFIRKIHSLFHRFAFLPVL